MAQRAQDRWLRPEELAAEEAAERPDREAMSLLAMSMKARMIGPELREIGRDRAVTASQANVRVSAVIAQFQELNAGLQDELAETEEQTSPGATPDGGLPAEPATVPVPSPAASAP